MTAKAEADLRDIDDWITSHESDDVAARIVESILTGIERLGRFAQLGRVGRIRGTRELGIASRPYTVIYRQAGADVIVLRVIHTAMQWPPSPRTTIGEG